MPTDREVADSAAKAMSELHPVELNVPFTSMNICASSPVPPGWIKTNDYWSPTTCGNPTSIVYNVVIIEQHSSKPIGSVMNVCSGAPIPPGWAVVNTYWSPTSCGHPTSIVHNVKQIRRVS